MLRGFVRTIISSWPELEMTCAAYAPVSCLVGNVPFPDSEKGTGSTILTIATPVCESKKKTKLEITQERTVTRRVSNASAAVAQALGGDGDRWQGDESRT